MRIASLALRGFRGATRPVEIRFDTTRQVVLVYGENGSGKSTIVDAFDFLSNRNFGSLENYSLGVGESARKHVTSLGGEPDRLQVTLRALDGATWTATLGRRGPVVQPEDGRPDAHILRRRDVTNVIEAPPSKRYEALKDYLTLPRIEKSEEMLRNAIRGLERQFDSDARSLEQAQDTLLRLWREEGQPGSSAMEWAARQASQDLSEQRTAVEEMTAMEDLFRSALEAREQLDRATTSHRQSSEARQDAQQRQQRVSTQTQQAAELLQLLRDAETFVANWSSIRSCPVCEQSVEAAALQARLQARLARAAELQAAMDTATAAETRVTQSAAVLQQARDNLCERARKLLRRVRQSRMDEILGVRISWDRYAILAREGDASEPAEQEARLALIELSEFQGALNARREAGQRSIAQHTAIRVSAEKVDDLQERVDSQRVLVNRLKSVLEVVSSERKIYAEDILVAISADVDRLYAQVHPDEPLGRVRFGLKRQATSSIELDAGFQNRDDLPPQAYYSESHLDTLGICVFLAMAKRFATDRSVVILDDVVTSVDAEHVDRFMAMLRDQAQHFNQIIVTTHERTWPDRYRDSPDVGLIELGEWSLESGLSLQSSSAA